MASADDVIDDVITVQVVARDDESGDEVSTLVEVEVLPRGRAGKRLWQLSPVVRSLTRALWPFSVPHGAFRERQLFGDVGSGLAAGIATLLLLLVSSVVFLLLRCVRRERGDEVEVVTLGNHPNLVPAPHCSGPTRGSLLPSSD